MSKAKCRNCGCSKPLAVPEDMKRCFECCEVKPLEAFKKTNKKYVLSKPANKGRCIVCEECVNKR